MNRFKAKFYEVEATEGLSREERRGRLKVYIENVYAVLPTNIRKTMPQIRQDILNCKLLLLKLQRDTCIMIRFCIELITRSIMDGLEKKLKRKGKGIWSSGIEKQKEEQVDNDGPSIDTSTS